MKLNIVFKLLFFTLFFNYSLYAQECRGASNRYKYKFKLLKEKKISIDTSKVKINGIYLSECEEIDIDGKPIKVYYFCRFFNNGKMYSSSGYCSLPTENDFNNLKYGFYREYCIEDDKIITEGYAPWCGYILSYYKVVGDKIVSVGSSDRKFTKDVVIKYDVAPYISEYKFYKCNVNSIPFW
ncbi:hypothetical protein GKZ90_0009120 [Flavobacterium sp. MC2016-06]|jgi:hypothetical protein|uniref:hypothetical protein n=1 Tax=Flavobacterium sp. MC2016-06 TaxID=2676308 RepID=UPI0012BB019E|nr:hypothetical protein [Flavobacterium sp. MC2016-06]MBU3859375.1 hypothetical protein [Flavobacterium sp. MC2016-06]